MRCVGVGCGGEAGRCGELGWDGMGCRHPPASRATPRNKLFVLQLHRNRASWPAGRPAGRLGRPAGRPNAWAISKCSSSGSRSSGGSKSRSVSSGSSVTARTSRVDCQATKTAQISRTDYKHGHSKHKSLGWSAAWPQHKMTARVSRATTWPQLKDGRTDPWSRSMAHMHTYVMSCTRTRTHTHTHSPCNHVMFPVVRHARYATRRTIRILLPWPKFHVVLSNVKHKGMGAHRCVTFA